MKGTIMQKGGDGSPNMFAAVKVKYPPGGITTITNGSKTFAADDTSGLALFPLPEPAAVPERWTITSTAEEKSKSQTISITEQGQVEEVTLSYNLEIITDGELSMGLEFATAIGGAAASVASGNGLKTLRTGAGGGMYITLPDFRDYSTLYLDVSAALTDWACIAVSTDQNHYGYGNMTTNAPVLKTFSGEAARRTYALDVSRLSPSVQYYLKFYGYNANFGLYNIWFE